MLCAPIRRFAATALGTVALLGLAGPAIAQNAVLKAEAQRVAAVLGREGPAVGGAARVGNLFGDEKTATVGGYSPPARGDQVWISC